MSSLLMLDPLSLVHTVTQNENERMHQAKTILDTDVQRNRFDNPLARDVATDRRELAALAMARAQGQDSMAAMQTAEAQRSLVGQPTAGDGLKGASVQSAAVGQQSADIAAQGAQQQVQESSQAMGQGLAIQTQDSRLQMMKDIKDRELATTMATMYMQNEARALGRKARLTAAERGIKADEFMQQTQQADQSRRRAVAGTLTGLGTIVAATEQAKKPGQGYQTSQGDNQ